MIVDDQTSRDLSIFPSRDLGPSVFARLDRTRTKGGHTALRSRFRNPLADAEAIEQVQDALRFLLKHNVRFDVRPDLIDEVMRYLESSWEVGTGSRWSLFHLDSIWIALRFKDLLRYADRGIFATRTLLNRTQELIEALDENNPPSELERIARVSIRIKPLLDDIDDSGHWPWQIMETDGKLRGRWREDIAQMVDALYELDALCAMADATREEGLEFPEVVNSDRFLLDGDGVFHLLLEDPVANRVLLSDEQNLVFLTGPNMAGKTTYLKSVAIAAFLAHLGMGVPAKRLRLSCFDLLFTGISPEENLKAGLSFFMAEVLRVREVTEALAKGNRALVLFDELFRGTNVKDAYEASLLVIDGFARCGTSGFLVSSHLVELADELKEMPKVRYAHFEGQITEGNAEYEFHLRPGVSDQCFGLHLLKQVGVPELLETLPQRASENDGL